MARILAGSLAGSSRRLSAPASVPLKSLLAHQLCHRRRVRRHREPLHWIHRTTLLQASQVICLIGRRVRS
jgi:hypothetical protein